MNEEIKELRANILQLSAIMSQQQAQIEALNKEKIGLRKWIEKLAAVEKLEWSQDADDWRDKATLDQLRKPR